MSHNLEHEINELAVNDEAKQVLKELNKVAASENDLLKQSLPGLFLTSPRGSGTTKYAETYSKIIDVNHVYKVHGVKTFLELSFPKFAPTKDYQLFFQSPKIVAGTQNRFTGVFVISFCEWQGNELIKDENFEKLLTYIDMNKANTFFVFHITPDFTAKRELLQILSRHVNVIEVELYTPDIEFALKYIEDAMRESGIWLSKSATQELKDNILADVLASQNYDGYATLDMLIQKMQYEIYLLEPDSTQISRETVRMIADKITQDDVSTKSALGFRL